MVTPPLMAPATDPRSAFTYRSCLNQQMQTRGICAFMRLSNVCKESARSRSNNSSLTCIHCKEAQHTCWSRVFLSPNLHLNSIVTLFLLAEGCLSGSSTGTCCSAGAFRPRTAASLADNRRLLPDCEPIAPDCPPVVTEGPDDAE